MREGSERGPKEGQQAGHDAGYAEGLASCSQQLEQKAHDEGYQKGLQEGQAQGQRDGRERGREDGESHGTPDGQADGYQRANNDANTQGTMQGRVDGVNQANASDASARGQVEGSAKGDADALARAESVDYPRGEQDYTASQFAIQPQSHDVIVQKHVPLLDLALFAQAPIARIAASHHGDPDASPDFRYFVIHHQYHSDVENNAYYQGAREGYTQGFNETYRSLYESAYQSAYNQAKTDGCSAAGQQNYQGYYDQGEKEGRDKGYQAAYDDAYHYAYQDAYNRAFRTASDYAYEQNYQTLYNQYYSAARASAYGAQYQSLYSSAFNQSDEYTYNERYPVYQQQQYSRGESDAAASFVARPLRIAAVEATGGDADDVIEPGEELRVHFSLRNFSQSAMNAADLVVRIQAQDPAQSVVEIGSEALVSGIKALSLTEVEQSLGFKMADSAAGTAQDFTVSVLYRGQVMDTQTLTVRPNYPVKVELLQKPVFQAGQKTVITLKLTNISSVSIDSAVASIKTDPNLFHVQQPSVAVAKLAPGESAEVQFQGVDASEVRNIPLAFLISSVSGKRIGALDLTDPAPKLGDYALNLSGSANVLAAAGRAKLAFQIQNTSARLLTGSLQLRIRFKNVADASIFTVVDANPSFVPLIAQSGAASATVLVAAANKGGVLDAELSEDGVIVAQLILPFAKH